MSSIVRHRPHGASPPRAFRRLSPSILRAAIRLITFHVSLFTHHFSSHHASRLTLSNAIQHFLTFMNSEPAISQEFPTKTIFHLGLRMSNLPCQTSPENLKKMMPKQNNDLRRFLIHVSAFHPSHLFHLSKSDLIFSHITHHVCTHYVSRINLL